MEITHIVSIKGLPLNVCSFNYNYSDGYHYENDPAYFYDMDQLEDGYSDCHLSHELSGTTKFSIFKEIY